MLRKLCLFLVVAPAFWFIGAPSFAADTPDKGVRRVSTHPQGIKFSDKLRVTTNRMGFEDIAINDLLKKFLDFAPLAPGNLMDLGCAQGFAIKQVLSLEAKAPFLRPNKRKILAIDMGKEHIEYVAKNTPSDLVLPIQMRFPATKESDVKRYFAPGTVGAVYAGLMVHYLSGPDLRQGLELLFKSVALGGRIYLSANSPFESQNMEKDFMHRKNVLKEEYPGWYENRMLPERIRDKIPNFIHVFDEETLSRYVTDAGFKLIDSYYFARGAGMITKKLLGVIAEKPNISLSKPARATANSAIQPPKR